MTTYLKEDGMTVVEREVVEAPAVVPVTTREVLHRAADLLEEFGWAQEYYAYNELGRMCEPQDREAVSFCAVGACIRAADDLGHGNGWGIAHGLDVGNVPGWNDQPGRTKAEVVARLRAAAESA